MHTQLLCKRSSCCGVVAKAFPVNRSIFLWFSHLFSSLFFYCCVVGLFLICIFSFSFLFYPLIFCFLWFQTRYLTYALTISFKKSLSSNHVVFKKQEACVDVSQAKIFTRIFLLYWIGQLLTYKNCIIYVYLKVGGL